MLVGISCKRNIDIVIGNSGLTPETVLYQFECIHEVPRLLCGLCNCNNCRNIILEHWDGFLFLGLIYL